MPFVVDMNITQFIIGIQQQHFSVNQFWSDLFLLYKMLVQIQCIHVCTVFVISLMIF